MKTLRTKVVALLAICLLLLWQSVSFAGVLELPSMDYVLHPSVASPVANSTVTVGTYDAMSVDYCASYLVVLDNDFDTEQVLFERKMGTNIQIGHYIETNKQIKITHGADSGGWANASQTLDVSAAMIVGVPIEISICYDASADQATINANSTIVAGTATVLGNVEATNGEASETIKFGAIEGQFLGFVWSAQDWAEAIHSPLTMFTGAWVPKVVAAWIPNYHKRPIAIMDVVNTVIFPVEVSLWEQVE